MRLHGDIQGIALILERLIDEHSAMRQYIRELAEQQNMLVDMLKNNLALAEQLQTNITNVKRLIDQGDGHGE
jgi:hypothetical protein